MISSGWLLYNYVNVKHFFIAVKSQTKKYLFVDDVVDLLKMFILLPLIL